MGRVGSWVGRSRGQTWDCCACLKWVPPAAHVSPITTVTAADQPARQERDSHSDREYTEHFFLCLSQTHSLCYFLVSSQEPFQKPSGLFSWGSRSFKAILTVCSGLLFNTQSSQISVVRRRYLKSSLQGIVLSFPTYFPSNSNTKYLFWEGKPYYHMLQS